MIPMAYSSLVHLYWYKYFKTAAFVGDLVLFHAAPPQPRPVARRALAGPAAQMEEAQLGLQELPWKREVIEQMDRSKMILLSH
jgi:hypothetical protein